MFNSKHARNELFKVVSLFLTAILLFMVGCWVDKTFQPLSLEELKQVSILTIICLCLVLFLKWYGPNFSRLETTQHKAVRVNQTGASSSTSPESSMPRDLRDRTSNLRAGNRMSPAKIHIDTEPLRTEVELNKSTSTRTTMPLKPLGVCFYFLNAWGKPSYVVARRGLTPFEYTTLDILGQQKDYEEWLNVAIGLSAFNEFELITTRLELDAFLQGRHVNVINIDAFSKCVWGTKIPIPEKLKGFVQSMIPQPQQVGA